MKKAPKNILKGKERGFVKVPLSEILTRDGTLKFNKNLNRGQIEVKQDKDGLALKIGGIIGRLPIHSNLAIDISPKFPMGNLTRLLSLSNSNLSNRTDIDRAYGKTKPDGFLPELLIRNFAYSLSKATVEGVHKQYDRQTVHGRFKPRINLNKTAQTFWSRGNFTNAVSEQFFYTSNNAGNMLISVGCKLALALSANDNSLIKERKDFAAALATYETSDTWSNRTLISSLGKTLSLIPSFKPETKKAIEIASELIKRTGIDYNDTERGIILPSYLINLEEAFESYIRNLLNQSAVKTGDLRVGDGNQKKFQRRLFYDNPASLAKPDIVFVDKDSNLPKLIGDVKYKKKITVEDRYQLISHALSYGVKTAFICSPANPQEESSFNMVGRIGTSDRHVSIWEYRMNLASDLIEEEEVLCEKIRSLYESQL